MPDDDVMKLSETQDPSLKKDSSPVCCPKCHRPGTMKRSNFRTGSVDKPKADVQVCSSCSHRVELKPE